MMMKSAIMLSLSLQAVFGSASQCAPGDFTCRVTDSADTDFNSVLQSRMSINDDTLEVDSSLIAVAVGLPDDVRTCCSDHNHSCQELEANATWSGGDLETDVLQCAAHARMGDWYNQVPTPFNCTTAAGLGLCNTATAGVLTLFGLSKTEVVNDVVASCKETCSPQ